MYEVRSPILKDPFSDFINILKVTFQACYSRMSTRGEELEHYKTFKKETYESKHQLKHFQQFE